MGKIKEWAGKIPCAIIVAIALGYSIFTTCVGKSDPGGDGANYQDARMRINEYSYVVAQVCMPQVKPDYKPYGVVVFSHDFKNERDANGMFYHIIDKISEHHTNGRLKAKYGNRQEKFFVCYGESRSIIVTCVRMKASLYSVSIEYAKTESYDWDYLSNRIKH